MKNRLLKVAFVCVHNSCRSQIAEALGKYLASDVFESYSAGTERKPQINQDAVRLMKEKRSLSTAISMDLQLKNPILQNRNFLTAIFQMRTSPIQISEMQRLSILT